MKINDKIQLPCGAVLPNRIAKSAMSENMAYPKFYPNQKFYNVYKKWFEGKTGLIITGNIMIDSRYLGETNNVVIEEGLNNIQELKKWSSSKKGFESSLWVQLNHPGKQTPKFLTKSPLAPSRVSLKPPLDKMFNSPLELTNLQIEEIINRFGNSARIAKECGFDGVQIHGAHGYLVSQFLSPLDNSRTDEWGGSLENRMRFVIKVYENIRQKVGDSFPIGIKLNSADFKKGGFSHQDAIQVAKKLSQIGIDLIELSGGSYEEPVMTGAKIKESTKRREAYFLEYAKDVKKAILCPLMVTGGFRTSEFIEQAIQSNDLDIIGLARSLCLDPNFSKDLLENKKVSSKVKPLSTGFKFLDVLFPLEIIWYTLQIQRLGENKRVNPNMSVYKAIFNSLKDFGLQSLKKVRA